MNFKKKDIKVYYDSLNLTNKEMCDFVDFIKVNKNVSEYENHLLELNFLIVEDEKEFEKRLNYLFNKNKKCFDSINILVAERNKKNNFFCFQENYISFDELVNNVEKIYIFFKETGLLELILKNKIKNFVDYAYGVEVGMDTNSRKNRFGNKSEKELVKFIKNSFENDELKIEEQVLENGKKYDIVITNPKNNKKVYIENSFYNSGGSKLSETARAYEKINLNFDNITKKFFWVADGKGMFTIRKLLESIDKNDFISNNNQIIDDIKNFIK